MNQGKIIDRLVNEFYTEAKEASYGFAQFAVPWGRKDSDQWRRKKIAFDATLRAFAKK